MAYQLQLAFNLGPFATGLTLNARLYDSAGTPVGATIVAGFVELGFGIYSYLGTFADAQVGTFIVWDSNNPTTRAVVPVTPQVNEVARLVWTFAPRVLTASPPLPSQTAGGGISLYRDTSVTLAITGLGNLSANTDIYFTVKQNLTDTDAQAVLQITRLVGLKVLNGSTTVTASDGALVVNDAAAGNITLTLKAPSAALLPILAAIAYDVKMITGSAVVLLAIGQGQATIAATVTRAIVNSS